MPDKHPYVSAPGGLVQVITHLRRSFPATVTAETLRKLGYAPKNESYVLNVLRHLEMIDDQGQRTADAQTIFSQHDDTAFAKQFAGLVKKAYSSLFELHGEASWTLDQEALITFFRSSDQTTDIVGKRQASTFQLLAGFAGHKDVPEAKGRKKDATKQLVRPAKRSAAPPNPGATHAHAKDADDAPKDPAVGGSAVGLTVRIEINLPADGDQDTYDRIFKSIRDNLLNG
ncbi:MAG: DUF5343 domain-containing protein [bacterium]|nr:DUF5343 domain-containing protein [bacterium]